MITERRFLSTEQRNKIRESGEANEHFFLFTVGSVMHNNNNNNNNNKQ